MRDCFSPLIGDAMFLPRLTSVWTCPGNDVIFVEFVTYYEGRRASVLCATLNGRVVGPPLSY